MDAATLTQTYDGTGRIVTATTNPSGLSGVTVTYTGASGTSYPASTTPPTNAGNYTVTATLTNADYQATDASGSLVVALKAQTITFAQPPTPATYGSTFTVAPTADSALAVSVSASGGCSILSGTVTMTSGTTPCVLTAAQAGDTNYSAATSVERTVAAAKADASIALGDLSQTYTGSPLAASASTTPAGLSGVSVSYSQNGQPVTSPTAAGSYSVTATLDNPNYTAAPASGTLVIGQATATVTLGGLEQTYDGTAKSATASTTPAGLTVTFTYAGGATAPTAAGSYAVVGTVQDSNYQGSTSGTLIIGKANTSTVVTCPTAAQTYTGAALEPCTAAVTGAGTLNESVPVTHTANVTVGTATASATYTGDANHEGSTDTKTFAIGKAPSATVVTATDAVYDGSTHGGTAATTGAGGLTASPAILYSGRNGTTYAGSATAPTNVGEYTATATYGGDDNHDGSTGSQDFAITPKIATVTADPKGKTYGDANPALTATVGGTIPGDTLDYSLATTATAGSGVGDYPIAVTPGTNPNYSVTATDGTLAVSARAVTITADAKTKTYGGTDPALTYAITSGTLASGDTFSGGLTRAAGENVGAYAIGQGGVALSANYTLTFVGADLTITARAVTITADAKSKTYGDAEPILTYQLTTGTLITGDSFIGSLTRAAGETVGGYAITQGDLALSPNYALSYVGADLTITAKAASVTPAAAGKIYGAVDPSLSGTLSGFLATDTVTATYSRAAGETVGTYTISAVPAPAEVLGNYQITYNTATFTIGKAPLTITAADKSKITARSTRRWTAASSASRTGMGSPPPTRPPRRPAARSAATPSSRRRWTAARRR